MTRDEVRDALGIGRVDDEELATLLSHRFPRGSSAGNGSTNYMTAAEDHALTLIYDKGVLSDVELGPALTDEDIDALKETIDAALLKDVGFKIHRSILFSLRPVEGWWRYEDAWQLLPAPDEAPRPPVTYAKHPAVLEIRVQDSADWLIRNMRAQRALNETRLLLSLVLDGDVTWSSQQGLHDWVLVGDPPDLQTVWAQLDYFVPNFVVFADDFTDVSDLTRLAETDPEAYFARRGIEMTPLDLPNNLRTYSDAYNASTPDDQERFLRACRWRYTATQAWSVAQSMHYTALVSAIETLIDEQASERCPACGKSTGPGPTARFKAFVEHYAPGSQSARERAALYSLRSAVSHGGKLLMGDTRVGFGTLHPNQVREWQQSGDLNSIVRVALLNWLSEKGDVGS